MVIGNTVFLFISLFMSHEKSTFIWKIIPVFSYLQFPWRFLVTANFFLCLTAGYFLTYLMEKPAKIMLIVFSFLVIFLNVSYFRPREWFDLTIWEKFSGQSWDKQLTISIFDYLPIYAKFPPAKPAPTYPYAKDARVSILDFHHYAASFYFRVKSPLDTVLTLPQFDFPGWQVSLDGVVIKHRHDNDLGLITFDLPAGDHKVKAILKDTPVRLAGDVLTLIFLPLGIYICTKK